MKMKEIKKKFKRFLAGGLMVCLMMPSFAGATWADVETYDYTGITRECFIDMDLDALQEQIEYAVSYDVRFNSSVMKFDSGDEELVKQYEKLFFDNHKEEPLYYVDYKFQEGILPVGSKAVSYTHLFSSRLLPLPVHTMEWIFCVKRLILFYNLHRI